MPAGRRDAHYQSALAKIDWLKLYREEEGFLLLEDTKAQWEQEFKPDYVLIDSRTGHTDVEGICTRQLPDAVVVLFFPNKQNRVGLRDVCRRIRAEATSGLKKHIRLHFVVSNVPNLDDEHGVIRSEIDEFRKDLKFSEIDAVIHRYEDVMLFKQAIFVLDRSTTTLAGEYEKLVWSLIVHNRADRDGALQFLRNQYPEYLRKFGPPKYLGNERLGVADPAGDALGAIISNFPDDPEVERAYRDCWSEEDFMRMELGNEETQSESPEQSG
jgi:hypothetical protein